MKYKIEGDSLPVLKIQLEAGECVECEAGAMSWMDNEIEMQTKAGGLGKMFGRMLTKENMFTNTYVAKATGEIAFSSKFPGSIVAINIAPCNGIIVQKGSFLAVMSESCRMEVKTVKGVTNVMFGGEGLFNTVVYGPGKVTLQSMPIASTAMQLYQYMPHPSSN